MTLVEFTDAEIEELRQEGLKAVFNLVLKEEGYIEDENGIVNPSEFVPGTHGYHEAVHTSHILTNMIDNELVEHPSVLLDGDAFALAVKAHSALFNLKNLLLSRIPDE